MKSIISIFLAAVVVVLCFAGCSNIPEEPATTTVANYSYVNPLGETAPAPANGKEGKTYPVEYIETVNDIELVLSSYYVYENNVATIEDIEFEDDGFSLRADGFADVKVTAIGSRGSDMKIAYKGYDAKGAVVRNSYILVPLDGVKKGGTVEDRRFDFPRDCVKIVFENYVEAE